MNKSKYPKYYTKSIQDTSSLIVWIIESPAFIRWKAKDFEMELKNIKEESFIGNDYVKQITEQEAALILSL